MANGRPSSTDVYQFLQSLGFTPVQAAGITGNLYQETGNFDPNVISGQRRGDNGTAFGMMQWRGDRQTNFFNFAKEVNRDPYDWRTQLMFVRAEMMPGKYADSGSRLAFQEMQNSRNPVDAAAAFVHAERPAGYTRDNPQAAHGFSNRAKQAVAVYGGNGNGGQGYRNAGAANRGGTASDYGVPRGALAGAPESGFDRNYGQGNYLQDDYNDFGAYSDGTGYNNPYEYNSDLTNPLGRFSDFAEGSMFNLTGSGYLGLSNGLNYDNTGYLRQFGIS